jgi:hypothetical protein
MTTNALTVPGNDPWRSFVTAFDAQSTMRGKLLKFSKGFWIAGSDGPELPRGTQLTARVDELAHGWTKWKGQKPVEHHLGRFAEGFIPPARSALGDEDESLWETDKNERPRDPWAFSFYLPLEGQGETYIFTTSSWGGKKAMRNLCDAYTRREKPELLPLVELDVNQRRHKDFGNIPEPLLDVVGWVVNPSIPQE